MRLLSIMSELIQGAPATSMQMPYLLPTTLTALIVMNTQMAARIT